MSAGRMAATGAAATLVLLLSAVAAAPQDAPAGAGMLRSVEQPTAREIARCFRGLSAPPLDFGMTCVLDAEGRPRQCEAYGLTEPQNRMVRSRVNCIGEQFRFAADDEAPLEGRRIHVPLTYSPAR